MMWTFNLIRRVRKVGGAIVVTLPPIIRVILNVAEGNNIAFEVVGEGDEKKVILSKV